MATAFRHANRKAPLLSATMWTHPELESDSLPVLPLLREANTPFTQPPCMPFLLGAVCCVQRVRQEVNGSIVLGSPSSLFLGLLFPSTMGGCCAFASWSPDLTLPSSLPVDFRLGRKLAGLSDQNGREWTSVVRDAAVELSCLRSVTSGKILFDCSSVYFGLQRLQYSALLVSQLHSLSG